MPRRGASKTSGRAVMASSMVPLRAAPARRCEAKLTRPVPGCTAHEPAGRRRPDAAPVQEGGEKQLAAAQAAAGAPAPAAGRPDRPEGARARRCACCSRAGTPRARAGRSSGWSRARPPARPGRPVRGPHARRDSGTTSCGGSGRRCPAGAAWPCSTAPGTAGCWSSGSRASPRRRRGGGPTPRSWTSRRRSPPRA